MIRSKCVYIWINKVKICQFLDKTNNCPSHYVHVISVDEWTMSLLSDWNRTFCLIWLDTTIILVFFLDLWLCIIIYQVLNRVLIIRCANKSWQLKIKDFEADWFNNEFITHKKKTIKVRKSDIFQLFQQSFDSTLVPSVTFLKN